MATPIIRRIVGTLAATLVATLVALGAVVGLAGPAHAEEGYQYWHYLQLDDDTWAFADTGPADVVPEDGSVEGFRFGTSTLSQPIMPRADLSEITFEAVCEGTESGEGEKRVAVVLDFGADEDAGTPPENRADCAVVDEAASTQDVLDTVADVRVEGGMTCALDGHPASGCGAPVSDAEVPATEEPVSFTLASDEAGAADAEEGTLDAGEQPAGDDGSTWLLVGLGLLVVVVGAAALAMSRRNKTA